MCQYFHLHSRCLLYVIAVGALGEYIVLCCNSEEKYLHCLLEPLISAIPSMWSK